MKIKKLKAKNLKGKTFDIDLGPVNVIVGDNWSGKTSVLTAIRLGLLGYDPAVGKRRTFENASGADMAVMLLLDEPNYIERSWRTVRGSVKAETTAPANWPGVPSLLLDVNDYFGMSGPERRDYVLSQLDLAGAGLSDEALTAKIKGIKVENHSVNHENEIADIIDEFDFWAGERDEHKTPMSEWLNGMVDRLKDEKIANRKKVIEESTALINQIASERATNPIGVPNDQAGDLSILRAERDELNQRLGTARTQQGQVAERARLEKKLSEIDVEKLKGNRDKVSIEVKAIENQWKRLKSPELTLAEPSLQPKIDVLVSRAAVAKADAGEIAKRQKELATEIEKAKAAKCCPNCGSVADYKKHKEEVIDELEKKADGLKSEVATALRRGVDISMELEESKEKEERRISARDKIVKLKEELANARGVLSQIESGLTSVDVIKASIASLASEAVSTADIETAIEKHDRAIVEAERKQKLRGQLLERKAQEALAISQRDDNEARLAVDKAWLEILIATQKEVIDDAFGPFVKMVRKFTDKVLGFELRYKDGDIGYVRDGQWVGHGTFSGAERALTYAGLGVALAQRSPVKVVLMDELILSDVNKSKVADRMAELIAEGVIDQFFICDVSATAWNVPPGSIIKV